MIYSFFFLVNILLFLLSFKDDGVDASIPVTSQVRVRRSKHEGSWKKTFRPTTFTKWSTNAKESSSHRSFGQEKRLSVFEKAPNALSQKSGSRKEEGVDTSRDPPSPLHNRAHPDPHNINDNHSNHDDDDDDDDDDENGIFSDSGDSSNNTDNVSPSIPPSFDSSRFSSSSPPSFFPTTARSSSASSTSSSSSSSPHARGLPVLQEWWHRRMAPHLKGFPRIQCHWEPTTTLKLQKTFRPLGTILKVGASFHTHLGVWKYESSWEDPIIGGQLTLMGRELQLTKSWALHPTPRSSLWNEAGVTTRLRCRASLDLSTGRATCRLGLRTERTATTWNALQDGYTVWREVPLDKSQHVKLQVQANVRLPEPEIEYSTEHERSLVGMGDVHVTIQELNVLLDY